MGWFGRSVWEGRSDHGRFGLPESGFEGTSGRRRCLSLNRTNGEAKGGARDFRAMSMNREASSAGAEKAEEGTALKT